MSIRITRMATQAKVFPIYEVENGKYKINVYPENEIPLKEYLNTQGRFRQITEDMLKEAQERADRNWESLIRMDGEA
jgi:pyruvate ferredoxin oxidoreductase beta subunit